MKSKIIKIVRNIWVFAGITFTVLVFYSFEAKHIDGTILKSNALLKVKETYSTARMIEPIEIANTSTFIASPISSAITGQVIDICDKNAALLAQ